MYYFDSDFLVKYLNSGIDLKVYVNSEYLDIADAYDVADSEVGYGYTVYGEPRKFDYRAIDQIMINGKVFTLDQLATAYDAKDGEKKSDDAPEETPKEAPTTPEEKPEKETEKEKAPEKGTEEKPVKESFRLDDFVENIDPKHSDYRTRGAIELIENGYITYSYYSMEKGGMRYVNATSKQLEKIR
jgi:hypothetical protein